jgi:hypothetical protein
MAKDAELDRLKAAQDLAFNRKQTAHDAQDTAWKRRKAAGDKMHTAFGEKDQAYKAQQNAWEDLQRLRDSKGPRIGQLNDLQERAFQNMKSSYDSASSAYDRRDGLGAKSYADQGRAYKAESQGYVEERRRLVAELRSAGDHQKSYAPAFQTAKGRFDTAKREFDAAKAAHERTQTEFKAAKAAFDSASRTFRARLDKVKSENTNRKNDRREIARRAGVPAQYLDSVWVSSNGKGGHNIYFGGVGEPSGPGHAHYVIDSFGNVTYKRDPFDPHGAQNFTENQGDYENMVMRESRGGDFGFRCRFRGYDAYVETNVNNEGQRKIDIYYGPNGPFGVGHHHAGALRSDPLNFIFDELR